MLDSEIISLFWKRDESALRELRKKYDALARSVAGNLLGDARDAEECINDSYLGMWNSIPPQKPAFLSAYFCGITRNLALKRLRDSGAQKRSAVFDELTDLISVPAEPSDPEEVGKAADVINDFLSKQSRSSRVLFLQRYYLGKSIREAAKCAGMTESGAKTRLSRMRAKLKVKLEEEGILL
ncbi:MAG: RNA polymerase sigma factor [Clostridia bacterium]|nr:RNA polymerase sigma factor [Clostridia bacterium]MBO4797775.1 RNA polymerase sigma factor [Candidatus Methanomethylophilaceae archaeon]